MATKQPARNLNDANYRRTFVDQTATADAQARQIGIPRGDDALLAINGDGTLTIRTTDEADGVAYNKEPQQSPSHIPAPRKLSNPNEGKPGA